MLDYKESWVPRNWCFWTVVLEKTLESPLNCKEIQPAHSKGGQSLVFIGRTDVKLKLQYFGHLMWRADSFDKPLMLRKIEGRRRRGRQRMKWLDGITNSMDMGLVMDREAWRAVVHGITKSQIQLSNWIELNWCSHGVLKERMPNWFAIPLSSGPRFVRMLHHDSSIFGGPTGHGS